MNQTHDPLRQVSYLQQCLSQTKRPLGLFLGAGCPVSIKVQENEKEVPLIQDIEGITQQVKQTLLNMADCSNDFKTIEKQLIDDGLKNPNVEELLSYIRALRVVAGKKSVRELTREQLNHLDTKMCESINDLMNKSLPNKNTPYHMVAGWTSATARETQVEIFTPNYDLLTEQAFEALRVPYFDGFAGACRPCFDLRSVEDDRLPTRWARIWKLHGSINWYQNAGSEVFRSIADEKQVRRVIHPSHLKYDESRRMPYLAMLDRLRAFLLQPSAILIVCGYSFRDDHLNEVIMQALQSNPASGVFALLFGELSAYSKAMQLACQQSNLSLLAKDEAVIGTLRGLWKEVESESAPTSDMSINWITVDKEQDKKKIRAEFNLGNFAAFGSFLQSLMGNARNDTEEGLAK